LTGSIRLVPPAIGRRPTLDAISASLRRFSLAASSRIRGEFSASGSGAVYVFARTGTTWAQEAYVEASNTALNDFFDSSVSLSSDGTQVAIGAYWEASNATGIDGNQASNSATDSVAAEID